ncbi:alpha/beta hydrolase family protein [Marisediminicola senii]|uniref:hypothetical protein n=1 Tax=Marisediminicola senii TaxID=2711233 RepID=UPI0013EE1F64|nr:hypothetical protein [Marisediminicola senii]
MSDELVIGGGGVVGVGTASLYEYATSIETAGELMGECAVRLASANDRTAPGMLRAGDAPLSAVRAERAIDDAVTQLTAAAERCAILASAVRASADRYGITEASAARLSQLLAADIGLGLGYFGSTIGVLMLPGFAATVTGGVVAGLLLSRIIPDRHLRSMREAIGENGTRVARALLSDSRVVDLLRVGVSSADDVGAGLLRTPQPVARATGDEGLGLVGLDTAASAVVAAGSSVGLLRETGLLRPVISGAPTTRAEGFADRADRVPHAAAQVRVDRYVRPGRPDRFEVYLGGTIDPSPSATDQPWDMTSNVVSIAGGDAGSYRAVKEAMEIAGVVEGSEIQLTGYSQGGLLAANLAASGDYDVKGIYTLGAPAGHVQVPAEVPWVAVEHTEDLVPALGGRWSSDDAIVVRREALPEVLDDGGPMLLAHQLTRYQETAALIDGVTEARVGAAKEAFTSFGADAESVETTWFESQRSPWVG